MKKIIICIVVCSLLFCFCGCDEAIEDLDINMDKMSLTLPDGTWYLDDESEESCKMYTGDEYSVTIEKGTYEDIYDWGIDSWPNNEEFLGGGLTGEFTRIDGYLTNYYMDEGHASFVVEYVNQDTYNSSFYGVRLNSEEGYDVQNDFREIIQSVSFDEEITPQYIGMPWEDMITDFPESDMGSESWDGTIQGTVAEVSESPQSNGKPLYIDIGNAYPDSNRITGIIWEESREWFNGMDFDSLEGEEVVLSGECYYYKGTINVKIEDDWQIIVIHNINEI